MENSIYSFLLVLHVVFTNSTALLCRADGQNFSPSSSCHPDTWFLFPFDLHSPYSLEEERFVWKSFLQIDLKLSQCLCGKYTDLLLPVWTSCEAAEVSLWCGGLTGSVFLRFKSLCTPDDSLKVYSFPVFPHKVCVCVCTCVCSWYSET